MRVLKLHEGSVVALAFSRDGRFLASASTQGVVRLWTWPGAELVVTHSGRRYANSISFSPDGSFWVWEGGPNNPYTIVGSLPESGGDPVVLISSSHNPVFGADGRTLYAVGWQSVIRREVGTWAEWSSWKMPVSERTAHISPESGLAVRADGARVAASVHDQTRPRGEQFGLAVWDAATGDVVRTWRGVTSVARELRFAPVGSSLLHFDGPALHVWDSDTGHLRATVKAGSLHFKGAEWTPDGRFLLSVGNDKTVRLWDADTWAERSAWQFGVGKLRSLAVTPDGLTAAAGSHLGRVVVWDLEG